MNDSAQDPTTHGERADHGVAPARESAASPAPVVPQVPGGRTLAGPWLRTGAKAIDVLVYVLVSWAALIMVSKLGIYPLAEDATRSPTGLEIAGRTIYWAEAAAALGLWFVLDVATVSLFGASIGKLVCGLRVVRTSGSPMSAGYAMRRAALQGVAALLVGHPRFAAMFGVVRTGVVIACAVMIFNTGAGRRDIYDLLGDSYVVTKD